MGAYDGSARNEASYVGDERSQWNSAMDQRGMGNLAEQFTGLAVEDASSKQSLFQVMKAVEAAENTIKHQMEEIKQLRTELQIRTREPDIYRTDASTIQKSSIDDRSEHNLASAKERVPVRLGMTEDPVSPARVESHMYSDNSKINGTLDIQPRGRLGGGGVGISQFSSPSSRSFSPNRYQKEGEDDSKFGLSERGLLRMSETNNTSNQWKEDLILKVKEHEDEVAQLRKHLADYSLKEAQICNEKHVLEKRIAYMRLAFDQQQQDLVDAASKALTYRQDIIEENIRLTYALQAAQQERSTFVSSLLPLLSEYGFQPPVSDAQSIVNSLMVLFKHLQENLFMTEAKLKASQYQIAPWHPDPLNNAAGFTVQSPAHSYGSALVTMNQNSLEIVPQQAYSHAQTPISSPLQTQPVRATDWETSVQHSNHTIASGGTAKLLENDNLGGASPLNRSLAVQDTPARTMVSQVDTAPFSHEQYNKQPSSNDLVVSTEVDDPDMARSENKRESAVHWATETSTSTYTTPTLNEPGSSYSPYLPPVLEEPSSSFSEAADDDPLPDIEGLQITGEAFPGRELRACGYSINGTTSCNFEWVRYLEDGSVNYIPGAKQPDYLVTADDVDSYLAIEVHPLDNRKRKGELRKVFANEQRKITCDPEMQETIKKILSTGHASFEVSLSAGYLDIWEPAILAIKREGYSIRCNGPRGVVVTEKFSPSTTVTIPLFMHPAEFEVHSTDDVEYLLRTAENSMLRDIIVLTMRLFIMRAVEKRKGKKRGLFFK